MSFILLIIYIPPSIKSVTKHLPSQMIKITRDRQKQHQFLECPRNILYILQDKLELIYKYQNKMGLSLCKECEKTSTKTSLITDIDTTQIGQYEPYKGPQTIASLNDAISLFQNSEDAAYLQQNFYQFITIHKWYKHKNREEYYLGQWVHGFKRGKGIMLYKDRAAYLGDFDRVPKGKGKYIFLEPRRLPEPDTGYFQFKGEIDNQALVEGVIEVCDIKTKERKSKVIFKGLKKDKIISYDDGKYYTGAIDDKLLRPQGKGLMVFSNHSQYQGQWRDGKPHGLGTFKYAGGDIYSGAFKEGLRQGDGRLDFKGNKRFYMGTWVADKEEGEGMLFEQGKVIYSGMWKAGKQMS